MILICHLLFGAAIVTKIKFLPLAFLLAFLSHYFLDLIPHADYHIRNIKGKKWRKSLPDFLKIILDLSLGLFLISIFSKNQSIIFTGAFLAILSDGFNFLNFIFPTNRILKIHYNFHRKIHFFKNPEESALGRPYGVNKKISLFWRIFSQVLIVLLAIFVLIL